MHKLGLALLALLLLPTTTISAQSSSEAPPLQRCINLGNMLEAPNEGEWGLTVQPEYLPLIAAEGFDSVRVPIRWSTHALTEAPYTIDVAFMARVQDVVDWSLEAGLSVIINVHHYEEIMVQPADHIQRLTALWEQIGAHFAAYPDTLLFEPLNEPHTAFTADLWNDMYPQLIDAIRITNPTRRVIIGGVNWNNLNSLDLLVLPEDRANLIATFHYYDPFQFTHQGAEWVGDQSTPWLGTIWGTRADYAALDADFRRARVWSDQHNVPLFVGEFGAYSRADLTARQLYTRAVREAAAAHGFGWCYWELASGFGIYNATTGRFNALRDALLSG